MKLSLILKQLYAQAISNPSSRQRRQLPNGLVIGLRYERKGELTLMLARYNVAPSKAEWLTVTQNLPMTGAPLDPTPFNIGNQMCLKASWKYRPPYSRKPVPEAQTSTPVEGAQP